MRLLFTSFLILAACSDTASKKPSSSSPDGGGGTITTGEELIVPVNDTRTFVKLASPPAVVTNADAWDLAFEGPDVFTSSGPSGPGSAMAFGPLDSIIFIGDTAPDVPFLSPDRTGGAFIRWYFYEGPPNHALFSRYHTFGVKDGDKLYKVQILSYYGKRDNAPVSALYSIRYAEVGKAAQVMENIDGTAVSSSTSPSECVDLGTGARTKLTPTEARASSAWHLCFRRQDISVNGELGGPRNVGAVDFDADKTAAETITEVVARTPESEAARFDAINADSFANQTLRGDRIVSAFSGLWTERGATPLKPGPSAWLVVGADGKSRYLVGFPRFDNATATSPGSVVMRVKAVQ